MFQVHDGRMKTLWQEQEANGFLLNHKQKAEREKELEVGRVLLSKPTSSNLLPPTIAKPP